MPDKHALLSASSSHRWINCPPSARLCAGHADQPSDYAQQGTDAHSLAEYKVLHALGAKKKNPRDDLTWFDREMDTCTDDYCSFVVEQIAEAGRYCEDPLILVEQRLDFSRWVPEGFGTGDCVIVADHLLQVIDFKYGLGVLVEAENNPQMMCYALGAMEQFDGIYDIDTVKMTIFQPRRDNISACVMSRADLLAWAKNTLKPAADLAYSGGGEFRAGDHCQFCKVKAS